MYDNHSICNKLTGVARYQKSRLIVREKYQTHFDMQLFRGLPGIHYNHWIYLIMGWNNLSRLFWKPTTSVSTLENIKMSHIYLDCVHMIFFFYFSLSQKKKKFKKIIKRFHMSVNSLIKWDLCLMLKNKIFMSSI